MLGDLTGSWGLVLFAQNGAGEAGPSSFFIQLLPFLPVLVLFYLLILRPQQVQERKRLEMIRALKKNDRVLTSSGMIGTVVSADDANDRVILKLGEDERSIKVPFARSGIAKVLDVAGEKTEKTAQSA